MFTLEKILGILAVCNNNTEFLESRLLDSTEKKLGGEGGCSQYLTVNETKGRPGTAK